MNRIGTSKNDKRRNVNYEKLYISKARASTNGMEEFYVDFLMADNNIKIVTNMAPENYKKLFSMPFFVGQPKSLINNSESTTQAMDLDNKKRDSVLNVLFSRITKMVVLITSTILLSVLGIYKYYDIIVSYVSDMYKHYVGSTTASNSNSSNMYTDTLNNVDDFSNIKGGQPIINNVIPTNNTDMLINNSDTLIGNNSALFTSDLIQKGVSTFTESSKMANESILPLVNNTETFENITNATNSTAFKNISFLQNSFVQIIGKYTLYLLVVMFIIFLIYIFFVLYRLVTDKVSISVDDYQHDTFLNNKELPNQFFKSPLNSEMIISSEHNLYIQSGDPGNVLNQMRKRSEEDGKESIQHNDVNIHGNGDSQNSGNIHIFSNAEKFGNKNLE